MHFSRRMLIQVSIFAFIALTAIAVMSLQFLKLPAKMFGIGRYSVTMQLPESGGLYGTGNVTYRGPGQVVRYRESGKESPCAPRRCLDSQTWAKDQYAPGMDRRHRPQNPALFRLFRFDSASGFSLHRTNDAS